jgi:hypothetical protein
VIKTTTSKKTFVGIGKPMNDVTKPEFDDQGYTLYADEETGEKHLWNIHLYLSSKLSGKMKVVLHLR